MNFSGYNHQQPYDPSQIQPYDQSYQPYYYAYNPQQYAYFPTTHQPHLQFQQESTSVHPPGVAPIAPQPREYLAVAPSGSFGTFSGQKVDTEIGIISSAFHLKHSEDVENSANLATAP